MVVIMSQTKSYKLHENRIKHFMYTYVYASKQKCEFLTLKRKQEGRLLRKYKKHGKNYIM